MYLSVQVGMQASDFEVIKEGALLRKSEFAGSFKPRHFVCTKVPLYTLPKAVVYRVPKAIVYGVPRLSFTGYLGCRLRGT